MDFLTGDELIEAAIEQGRRNGLNIEGTIVWMTQQLNKLGIEGNFPPSELERLRDALLTRLPPPATVH